jgi:hypothetical protein
MRSAGIIIAIVVALGSQAQPVLLKPEWGVVLPEEQAKVFWKPRLCNRPAPGPIQEIWIPDAATVRRLEAALGPALQEAIDESNIAPDKPHAGDFYRQYAGFVVGGERIVYINGLHQKTIHMAGRPLQWQTQAFSPCDGGMLFFGAEYVVEAGTVRSIVFNGGGRGRTG